MKRSVCAILAGVLVALLVACDARQDAERKPAAPAATAEPPGADSAPVAAAIDTPFPDAGNYEIDLAPGNISIRANQVDELELLESIALTAGFELLTADVAWRTVTVDIREATLHAALAELLGAHPYQIVYTPDAATQQEVLSEVVVGAMPGVATPDSAAAPATGDVAAPGSPEDPPDPGQQAALQELRSPSAEVRARAAAEIEPVGAALYVLSDLVANDPAPGVRIASIRALEFSEDPLALQALASCLKDADISVVIECTTTLEHIGDRSSVVHLQPLLMHYDESVRNTAAEAIETLQ